MIDSVPSTTPLPSRVERLSARVEANLQLIDLRFTDISATLRHPGARRPFSVRLAVSTKFSQRAGLISIDITYDLGALDPDGREAMTARPTLSLYFAEQDGRDDIGP